MNEMRILHADDNDLQRGLVERTLRRSNDFKLESFEGGSSLLVALRKEIENRLKEAIAITEDESTNLITVIKNKLKELIIITDYNMPEKTGECSFSAGINGEEVIKKVIQLGVPRQNIILLCEQSDELMEQIKKEYGVHILKKMEMWEKLNPLSQDIKINSLVISECKRAECFYEDLEKNGITAKILEFKKASGE